MQTIALLTQHEKQTAIEGPLAAAGYAVTTVTGFDTDTLGTFTGEVARRGTALEAALSKAKKAVDLSQSRYGLGSEGSFGPDPYTGLTGWARETLVWWDAQAGYAVYSTQQGPQTNFAQATVSTPDEAVAFCREARFPSHGIILGKPYQSHFTKNIPPQWEALQAAIEAGLRAGPLWLETDMRAHRNPTRMDMIGECALLLSKQLRTACPACHQPGFGIATPLQGARCIGCGQPTHAVRANLLTCSACQHATEVYVRALVAPAQCEYCNP